jgi:hypothetical protein
MLVQGWFKFVHSMFVNVAIIIIIIIESCPIVIALGAKLTVLATPPSSYFER